jgi:hypothetical protein
MLLRSSKLALASNCLPASDWPSIRTESVPQTAVCCRARPHGLSVTFGVTGESHPSSSEDTNSLADGRLISRGFEIPATIMDGKKLDAGALQFPLMQPLPIP